jgi:hypothetical protein
VTRGHVKSAVSEWVRLGERNFVSKPDQTSHLVSTVVAFAYAPRYWGLVVQTVRQTFDRTDDPDSSEAQASGPCSMLDAE